MEIQQAEKFDNVVRQIFSTLLEAFPIPIDLEAVDLGICDLRPVEEAETIGGVGVIQEHDAGPEEQFFDHCLAWLQVEGYVGATRKTVAGFKNVVLTHKGLSTVNAVPQSLNPDFND